MQQLVVVSVNSAIQIGIWDGMEVLHPINLRLFLL